MNKLPATPISPHDGPQTLGEYEDRQDGKRLIVESRIGDRIQIADVCAVDGAEYVIHPDVGCVEERDLLVADYLAVARERGRRPITAGDRWFDEPE